MISGIVSAGWGCEIWVVRGVWGYSVGKNLGEKKRKVEKEEGEGEEEGQRRGKRRKEGSERERERVVS